MAQRFRPSERLSRRAEFQRVYDRGVRIQGRYMTLCIVRNALDVTRLGIVATRRLGGAVRRNRAKRLIREVFRRNKFAAALDIVVIPRGELLDASLASLEADYCSTLRRFARRN